MPILYISIIIIFFCVLQFLVLLIVYFNLFSIRNISFSFACHQLCVLFPLLGGADCVIMDFNYPTAFDYSNRQRNQRTLVKRLIRLAQSHCPLPIVHFPMGKSISQCSPCKSINQSCQTQFGLLTIYIYNNVYSICICTCIVYWPYFNQDRVRSVSPFADGLLFM